MADLNVTFAGLALTSPLIAEFRDDVPPPEIMRVLEKAGAGALLLPPLNEARLDWSADENELTEHNNTDAAVRRTERMRRMINRDAYIEKVAALTREAQIPVIGALQCRRPGQWINLATAMEEAGAAAVELHPVDEQESRRLRSDRIEKEIIRTANRVAPRLDISVLMRLVAAPFGMQPVLQNLADNDVKGVILTGSEYLTAIDPDSGGTDASSTDGRRGDAAFMNSIASVQLLYRRVVPHLAPRIPPDSGSALIEAILAGATLVSLPIPGDLEDGDVSSLLGQHISTLRAWMRRKGFSSLFDFRGVLSDSRRSSSLENA